MRNHISAIIILGVIFIALLFWIQSSRIADFRAYHTDIAQASSQGVAKEISRFVNEKKRLVDVFTNKNLGLIRNAMQNQDEASLDELKREAEDFFPHHFALTIADTDGHPLFEDFDGDIGAMCVQDLVSFARSQTQSPRIHPNASAYHFDVLAPIGDNEGILFISFHADILGGTLKAAQSPSHQLLLISEGSSNLIEVTADGARINWDRDDYRLSEEELSRVLYKTPVDETVWHAINLHSPNLFKDYQSRLSMQIIFIFSLYMLITLIMYMYLRREEKLRQEAEAHKDEFLSTVSHELRTPLTVINGALALIANGLTGNLDDKTKDLAQRALSNAKRLMVLVNDLLDVQKIEAGKMEYQLNNVALKPFLEQCVEENKIYGEQHHARFTLHPIPTSAEAYIDENRIAQVMANLLSNAAKYGAEEDNIDIVVEEDGSHYKISVSDHGKGINQELQQKLFQKFSQGDSGTTRTTTGTGLGLYLVRRIIEQHGGIIGLISSAGTGTTFYFTLPKAV